MGAIRGERMLEIDAPVERCFQIAADIERATSWQAALEDVDVLQRDAEGRPKCVDASFDARVRTIRVQLWLVYVEPSRIEWNQERGDVKSLHGWWQLDDLGNGRTRATYGLEVDPGRMLGMLLRGSMEGKVREFLLAGTAEGLKERAERP
jgi:hypothetical protein